MALRVLLADESSTIKKVFQLALQDFGVEVRPVNLGVDVAAVTKAFKPDIIFADVMLQKKNGYDVCSDLKQDSQTKAIPFVLMWSGFLELDEDKYQASQANAQLEKPFDVAALRKLVSELVPRTQSQNLSEFLTFPKVDPKVEFQEKPVNKGGEEFTQVPIPKMKGASGDKYRLNLKPEELDPSHIAVDYKEPSGQVDVNDIFKTPDADGEEEFKVRDSKKAAPPKAAAKPIAEKVTEVKSTLKAAEDDLDVVDMDDLLPPAKEKSAPPPLPAKATAPAAAKTEALSAEQLEKIIREQSAEVIESVVWKVIPELAAQIIERELNKLLKERDANPY